jgi:hypothetical protein
MQFMVLFFCGVIEIMGFFVIFLKIYYWIMYEIIGGKYADFRNFSKLLPDVILSKDSLI